MSSDIEGLYGCVGGEETETETEKRDTKHSKRANGDVHVGCVCCSNRRERMRGWEVLAYGVIVRNSMKKEGGSTKGGITN